MEITNHLRVGSGSGGTSINAMGCVGLTWEGVRAKG